MKERTGIFDPLIALRIVTVLAVVFGMIAAHPAAAVASPQDGEVEVSSAVMNPFKHLGKTVRWEGIVDEIISSGLVVRALIKTDGFHWLASFYVVDIPDGLLRPGSHVFIEGTLIGFEKIMVAGTQKEVLVVMARGVPSAPLTTPPGQIRSFPEATPEK